MDRHAPGDVELAERLMARDESALRDVIAAFGTKVHGMARRVLTDPALAEEVTQDAFLALWRRPGAFDPERGSLLAFLLGVARNKAIDLVRREESLKRTRDALVAEVESQPAVSDDAPRIDEREELTRALRQLSPAHREAIVLAYYGGRTYREVATELAIPEGTAKTRLRDGLMKLRQLLAATKESDRDA
jgi:RNA polymerase sigma-70 factor (ECF subfamily)